MSDDFIRTLPDDDDDVKQSGSAVIRREEAEEAAASSSSSSSRSKRGTKRAAPAAPVVDDSDSDDDNDGDDDDDHREKLNASFEFDDVVAPAAAGTWANYLFSRTGEDNALHEQKGRSAARATTLATKIERRLEKKSKDAQKKLEDAAFASFAATGDGDDDDADDVVGDDSDDSDDDAVERKRGGQNDDDDDDDSDGGSSIASDDSDLATGVDIPVPDDDTLGPTVDDDDIENGGDDNNDNDGEGDDDSSESKEAKEGKTPSGGDDLPADKISTKSHNRRGDAAPRVSPLDSKTVAAAPKQRVVTDFAELKLSRPLLRAVKDLNFVSPTPVQHQAIPLALTGADILVNAMTGSGKTAAFMLPILERLLYRPRRVPVTRVLVLTPTRELADQCVAMTKALMSYTDIRVALVVGGMAVSAQEQALRTRPDIVVATPGRMIDHLRNAHSVHFEDIEILVLDEADRLLELGFADEVREIVKACPRQRQTMLYSATLTEEVVDLVNLSLNDPKRVTIDSATQVVERLTQEFVRIRNSKNDRDREAIVISLCKRSFTSRTIVFCRTKVSAHRLALIMGLVKLRAAELHGNLSQQQRLDALEQFRQGQVDYLICTDLAARGLDIKGVETVINMSLPKQLSQYVHRVGRTARAGRAGHAITLVDDAQRKTLKEIIKGARSGVKNRVIATEVLDKYRQIIGDLEDDIATITAQEKTEKNLRVAEEQANRASNMMKFEKEIHSRPARTWFQSGKEKMANKLLGTQLNVRPGDEEKAVADAAAAKEQKLAEKQAAREAKKKDKDPLKGLSRKKKRRKLMVMEAEKMAAERKAEMAAMGVDENGMAKKVKEQKGLHSSVRSAKASKFPTKAQLDGDDPVEKIKRSKKAKAARITARYAEPDRSRDRRYEAPAEQADEPKKPFRTKSKRAFKSQSKYKRRDRK